MKSVSIVIPIYNEERYLKPQVRSLMRGIAKLKHVPRYEIILVENGSSDATLMLVNELVSKHSVVRSISLPKPSYGEAFKEGVRFARNDIVVQFDLDFWSVKFLETALDKIKIYDIVIGSKNLSDSVNKRPMLRHFLSRFIEQSIRLRFNVPMTDTHGMKALRRDILLPVIDHVSCQNHFLDTELLIRLFFNGCTYTEVPIQFEELRGSRFSFFKRAREVLIEYMMLMMVGLARHSCNEVGKPSYA